METAFATSMDAYLDYLRARVADLRRQGKLVALQAAEAEYSRALAFARRNGQTSR